MGARAYRYLALYDPAPGCLIEVGSERGEGSTAWLARYARRHKLRFYTADIDPGAHKRAAKITPGARLLPGVELLKRVRDVSVAYLDGFDWKPQGKEGDPFILEQQARYRRLGHTLTNEVCQRTHLEEAMLVAGRATSRCVVVLDDTFRAGRNWSGKGGLAVPYLTTEGFEIAIVDEPAEDSLGAVVMRRW